MSKKNKKVCKTLNYVNYLLTLASTVTSCISIFAFASLVGIPIGITSSAATITRCVITVGIKTHKSIIKKKRRNHDKIVLLGKTKSTDIEVWIPKSLTDSYISHDEFVSVNNGLREYNDTRKRNKNKKSWNFCGICNTYTYICIYIYKSMNNQF